MIGTIWLQAYDNSKAVQETEQPNLQYKVGDIIKINGEERKVVTVTNSSHMVVNTGFTNTSNWRLIQELGSKGLFDKEPVTTEYSGRGERFDEVHVVVVDEDGEWTDTKWGSWNLFRSFSSVKRMKMVQKILCSGA